MDIIEQAREEAPERTDEELEFGKKACSTYMVDTLKHKNVSDEELEEAKRVSRGVFKVINAEIERRNENLKSEENPV